MILIDKGQVLSFIAFHLVRSWPENVPPNIQEILEGWNTITERDFDEYGSQKLLDKELSSYLETTLTANPHFRELSERIDVKTFIYNLCYSVTEEIKELKE